MKQEKQRISSLRQSPWFPLVGYCAILLAFCLFCTRLFFKTDDGNFTGILLSPDFSLYGFLSQRYLTWSGRTVGEALLMLFLRAPLVCWKLVNFGLLFYISYFLCRLFTWAEGPLPARERILFGSASLWMIFFLSLNSPAFWFSATFFYVWPAAAMLYTLSPLVALLFGQKVRWRCLPLWCLAAVLAASQEQSCALTLTFFLLLLAALWMREKHFRPIFLLQLLILAAETAWVLLSPGGSARTAAEAAAAYPNFPQLSLLQKLCGGLVNLLAHQFFYIQLIAILLLAFLSIAALQLAPKKWLKILLAALNGVQFFLCVPFNILLAATRGGFQWLNAAFAERAFDWAACLALALGLLCLLADLALSLFLWLRRRDAAHAGVLLCILAAYASAMTISLSPTIYSSGQRVFFYTDILLLAAIGLLYCTLPQTKAVRRLRIGAYGYAGVNFILDVILFTLLELPWLG